MSSYYDRTGKPITWDEYIALQNSDPECYRVALIERNGVKVSTVWLGIDHNFGSGEISIFETMVFGGKMDEYCVRYATEAEALAGHAEIASVAVPIAS